MLFRVYCQRIKQSFDGLPTRPVSAKGSSLNAPQAPQGPWIASKTALCYAETLCRRPLWDYSVSDSNVPPSDDAVLQGPPKGRIALPPIESETAGRYATVMALFTLQMFQKPSAAPATTIYPTSQKGNWQSRIQASNSTCTTPAALKLRRGKRLRPHLPRHLWVYRSRYE